jgi:hypothetical protein
VDEQLRRAVGISGQEPDLPEAGVGFGDGQPVLNTLVSSEFVTAYLSRRLVTASRTACRSGASSRSVELTKTRSR